MERIEAWEEERSAILAKVFSRGHFRDVDQAKIQSALEHLENRETLERSKFPGLGYTSLNMAKPAGRLLRTGAKGNRLRCQHRMIPGGTSPGYSSEGIRQYRDFTSGRLIQFSGFWLLC